MMANTDMFAGMMCIIVAYRIAYSNYLTRTSSPRTAGGLCPQVETPVKLVNLGGLHHRHLPVWYSVHLMTYSSPHDNPIHSRNT